MGFSGDRAQRVRKLGAQIRTYSSPLSGHAVIMPLSLPDPATARIRPVRKDFGAERPNAILWVGNSFFFYNNGIHRHVRALVKAADPKRRARAVSVTISGSGMDWHDMESYFRPDGIGRYSFGDDNEIVFNKPGRQFDTVIMMDSSQGPIHPELKGAFQEYAKQHIETVIRHGAKPVLFMSWAYRDRPEMTAGLADQYTIAANENDALVIPAGLAFAGAISKRSDLDLHQADKRHPSWAGTYLAACTTFATLYGLSPVGNAYAAGIDADTARFLQVAAWEKVQEYFSQ